MVLVDNYYIMNGDICHISCFALSTRRHIVKCFAHFVVNTISVNLFDTYYLFYIYKIS